MKTLITTHKEYQELFPTGGCVIEESDKFKNEVCIHTFNLHKEWIKSDDASYLPCGCFCVLFKSNPSGEILNLVSTYRKTRYVISNPIIYNSGSVIININGIENIVLQEHTEIEETDFTHFVFPISKQDFDKCCRAKSMSIRLMVSDGEIGKQFDDISTLILAFRALWNKAIDNSMYSDSVVELETLFENIINESIRIHAEKEESRRAAMTAPKKKKGLWGLFK